jgi:voltage-gated potassium channel
MRAHWWTCLSGGYDRSPPAGLVRLSPGNCIRASRLVRSAPHSKPDSHNRPLGDVRLHYRGAHTDAIVRKRLLFAGLSLMCLFAVGTAGFWWIGDGRWPLFDCVYMVVITVTTVGYGEILPISEVPHGRAFTIGLLISGLGLSLYFLSSLTAFIIEGDLREALWRRRMMKRLKGMVDHYVVCGAGVTGRHVITELVTAGGEVVVVELDVHRLDRLVEEHGEALIALEGDATEDEILKEAGVESAQGLVTTLQSDQDNLFVALSARQMNPHLRIVSRASTERAAPKLRQAGADVVISPTQIGGRRMAHEMLRPTVVGFLDFISQDVERNLDIEEVPIGASSPLVGRKLMSSRIREVSNALVLAVIADARHVYNPPPEFEFKAGMTLIVLGEREPIERLKLYVSGGGAPTGRQRVS